MKSVPAIIRHLSHDLVPIHIQVKLCIIYFEKFGKPMIVLQVLVFCREDERFRAIS